MNLEAVIAVFVLLAVSLLVRVLPTIVRSLARSEFLTNERVNDITLVVLVHLVVYCVASEVKWEDPVPALLGFALVATVVCTRPKAPILLSIGLGFLVYFTLRVGR